DAGTESKFLSPLRREIASDTIRTREAALNARSYAREQRINFDEEVFRRQATQFRVPHPFVAHGANTARNFLGCANAAQHRRYHVAMFQGGGKALALLRIVAQPVQQLRPSPF